jgi:outer membrane protein TolC
VRSAIRLIAALTLASLPALAQALPAPAPAPAVSGPLTLDQAIAHAIEQDPVLLTQLLQARSAVEDVRTAQSNILPNLTFNASYSRTRVGGGESLGQQTIGGQTFTFFNPVQIFPGYGVGLTVRQLIFDGGKWWNNLAAFDKALAVQREQAEEQRLQTAYLAAQKFYELIRAQRTLNVLKEASRRSGDQADWTQKLFEGGRATQADVYAARANRDNDAVSVLSQEAVIENARQDLAIAIGRDPAQPLTVVDPPNLSNDPSDPPNLQESIDKALSRRPSLRAFAAAIEQMKKNIDVAKGDYYPSVSFTGQYQRSTRSLDDFTKPLDQANTLSGAITLNWNLFAGFATDANVNRAIIQLQLAQVNMASGRRGVASDVERAIANWTSARTRAAVTKQAEENSVKNLDLARARQQVGVGTQLEVRDAELKVTQAQLSRLGALVDGHEAEAALRRAVGDI